MNEILQLHKTHDLDSNEREDVRTCLKIARSKFIFGTYSGAIYVCEFNFISNQMNMNIIASNRNAHRYEEIGHPILDLCKLSDNSFASCSRETIIKVWEINQSNLYNVSIIDYHEWQVNRLIKLNNDYLVSCSSDETIKIFHAHTFNIIKTLREKGYVYSVLALQRRQILVSTCTCFPDTSSSYVNIWNIDSFETNDNIPNERLLNINAYNSNGIIELSDELIAVSDNIGGVGVEFSIKIINVITYQIREIRHSTYIVGGDQNLCLCYQRNKFISACKSGICICEVIQENNNIRVNVKGQGNITRREFYALWVLNLTEDGYLITGNDTKNKGISVFKLNL